jgi:ABC-type multidrug transport system fused ATPase/permease subunit
MTEERPSYFWRFVREFVLPHRLVTALLVGNVLLQAVLTFWLPYAAKEMVDRVLAPVGAVDPQRTRLALWLIVSVGLVIAANQALVYLFNRLMYRLISFISQRLRSRVAGHLLKLSQHYYDGSQLGRLMVTALGDPSNITQQLAMGMINALAQAFVVLGGCFYLFYMNVSLSLAVVAVFPLMVLVFFAMRPRLVAQSALTRENWGIMSGMVAEKVAGIRVVRTFVAEDIETERFRYRVDRHAVLNTEVARLNALYGFFNGLCIHLGYMMVFLVGGLLYFKGQITLGTIVAFYGFFNRLFPAVLQICNLPQQVLSARGSLDKVFGLLDEPLLIVNRPGAKRFEETLREIRFDAVNFRYGPHLPSALAKLDLSVQAGTQVGIVGPSGSGKSTLMALLLRFYEPVDGQIRVNGSDLRDWEMQSLRRAFALVPQEPMLFTGSVRENLSYGREAPPDAELWQALEEAEAAEFVRKLDGGLDSIIGERGVSLSGGQKQRLSIARALITQPQCLILDNCTSALDGETEQRLQETLRRVLKGRTALIISHRSSSVLHCQQVLVMDAGRVVESGTPADLLAQPSYFASIHRQQAGMANGAS